MNGSRSASKGVCPPAPLVCILSGVPLGAGGRFALAARMTTLATDLIVAGLDVLLLAPDGTWRASEEIGHLSPGLRGDSVLPAEARATSMNVLDAVRVLSKATRALQREDAGRRTIVLATGVWMPLASRLLAGLRPATLLHLDVPGIPQKEIAISRPRLWRLKIPIYRWVFSRAVSRSAVVTTINETHARFLRQEYGVDPLIVPDRLKEEWLRDLMSLPDLAPRAHVSVLYAGSMFGLRLEPFLRALCRVRESRQVGAIIVGDGPDRARYRAVYESQGVQFPGFIGKEELLRQLEAADICYSDVWHEIGTPYKVLEYMAAGRSVLSHDTTSLRETITDHVDGILCPSDEASLVYALKTLIEDADLRVRLGSAARRRARELHTGDRLGGLVNRYMRALSQGCANTDSKVLRPHRADR